MSDLKKYAPDFKNACCIMKLVRGDVGVAADDDEFIETKCRIDAGIVPVSVVDGSSVIVLAHPYLSNNELAVILDGMAQAAREMPDEVFLEHLAEAVKQAESLGARRADGSIN